MDTPNLILDLPTEILVLNLFPYLVSDWNAVLPKIEYKYAIPSHFEESWNLFTEKRFCYLNNSYILLSSTCKRLRNLMTDRFLCVTMIILTVKKYKDLKIFSIFEPITTAQRLWFLQHKYFLTLIRCKKNCPYLCGSDIDYFHIDDPISLEQDYRLLNLKNIMEK